jgi:molybdopterin converting factor small subunit
LTYKTRNIIILSIFILLVTGFMGYVNLFYYPGKIDTATEQNEELKKQIATLDNIEEQYFQLKKIVQEKEKKLSQLDKKIVAQVSSAESYNYLNQILGYVGFIEFNLYFTGSFQGEGYGYNTYTVRGETAFKKIYDFIWYLERGPSIYKINKLQLRAVESIDPETEIQMLVVPFEMELLAYYAEINDLPPIRRTLNNVWIRNAKNIFYPYVLRNLPPNVDNLIEVERAELRAIIPGKILIADHEGKIHVLQNGDEVYLGYLTRIDTEKKQVEFTLNKGGIYEKFTLDLKFEETTN